MPDRDRDLLLLLKTLLLKNVGGAMGRAQELSEADVERARPPLAHPDKKCGPCNLCCKTMGVVELSKPANQWCDLCVKGKGCTIYDHRPQSCVDFACVWLQAPSAELDDR